MGFWSQRTPPLEETIGSHAEETQKAFILSRLVWVLGLVTRNVRSLSGLPRHNKGGVSEDLLPGQF
jgi:hypothetical protein